MQNGSISGKSRGPSTRLKDPCLLIPRLWITERSSAEVGDLLNDTSGSCRGVEAASVDESELGGRKLDTYTKPSVLPTED